MWSIRPNTARDNTLRSVRVALIANRASGGGLDPEPLVRVMRDHGADVTVHGCEPDDLETAAAEAPDRLVVAGGDGTVGPVAELAGRLDVPLGVVPAGTANDFVRANGLPEDARAAAALAVAGRELRRLELGRLGDGRPFVNVASVGLASVAARRAQPLKPRLGPLAYAVGALRAAATAHPLPCTVRTDEGVVFDGRAWQVIVAVTGAFGGGSGIARADPEDGVLDVTVIPGGSRLGLARRAWGLRTHTIAEQRDVPHVRGRVVALDVPPGTEFNVDGELRNRGLDEITVRGGAYALVVGT
jgi:diacylglycerol kinase (ATP)